MTPGERQELIQAARKRLDQHRLFLLSEMLKGRMTQNLSDQFGAMRRAISELKELKR